MPGSKSEIRGRFFDGLGSSIVVQHSDCSIITLHGQITARNYMDRLGNQVHPFIHTLFPNNTVFQDDNPPIHTAGTVQSRFEEPVGEHHFPGQHNHTI
jgi:hypothetical protein